MRRTTTLFKMVAAVALMGLFLSACGQTATKASTGGKLAVGVVLPTKDEPRWIQDQARFNDAFTAAGYDVTDLRPRRN